MWVWSGLVLSLALAVVAWARSRSSTRTYYEGEVYGMTALADRRYALGFAGAAALFLAGLAWPGLASPLSWWPVGLLALVVLAGLIYASGFLRGATGEDE